MALQYAPVRDRSRMDGRLAALPCELVHGTSKPDDRLVVLLSAPAHGTSKQDAGLPVPLGASRCERHSAMRTCGLAKLLA